MSAIFATAAQRRRTCLLATTFLVPALFGVSAAKAQQLAQALPPIEITSPDENRTRAKPKIEQEQGSRRVAPSATPTRRPNAAPSGGAAATNVTAVRQFSGIVGASTSVITADDIAHSPAQTVQEIIAQTPGVQLTSLYGGVNGVKTSVDIRGFGAFATSNTLVLINGRRLNDIDMAGVDFSTIPRDSIERIEITRGNSGAVLYGDNAVGGVINIVLKNGVGGPPVKMRAEAGVGSFNSRMASVSAATNYGPWSTSFYGNGIKSDGYRVNNALDQRNGVGNLNYTTPGLTAFVTLSGDDQKLGFPGGRLVDPSIGLDELATNRRGAATPFDYGNQQGASATAGFTKTLMNGVDLIVDGGVRDKKQQSRILRCLWQQLRRRPFADLVDHTAPQHQERDVRDALGHPDRHRFLRRDLPPGTSDGQRDAADPHLRSRRSKPWPATGSTPSACCRRPMSPTAPEFRTPRLSARDRSTIRRIAPVALRAALRPFRWTASETQYALHVGVEHRFNDMFSVFGRAARAFRTPNVDERVSSGPSFDAFFNPIPGNFSLKTQTSHDIEGGFRIKSGGFQLQSSIYNMDLDNEIHFIPALFYNVNLDPTRRYGSETSASLRLSDSVTLRGGAAYTRAVFREGEFAGKDVPLVSRYTASGGVAWNIWQKYLVADATVRAWSERFMDNDQANTQRRIPANATVDFKLSGEYGHFFWSLGVNNLLNALYYDYAIASSFTAGRFSAYPLAGRTWMVKAGATF